MNGSFIFLLRKKKKVLRSLSVFMVLALILSFPAAAYTPGDKDRSDYEDIIEGYTIDESILGYKDYLAALPQSRPAASVTLAASDFARYEVDGAEAVPHMMADYEGVAGSSVLTVEDALIEYEVDIPESGLYDLSLLYYPVEGKSSAIQRGIFVDGALPYQELATVEFPRVWSNRIVVEAEQAGQEPVWEKDNQGNDLKPSMVECPEWIDSYLYDSEGYVTSRLSIYLEKGKHTLTIMSLREPMLLNSITLSNEPYAASYAETLARWQSAGAKDATQSVSVLAQYASRTSSQMLYPKQDQSSPTVSPSSSKMLLNNTIGGASWRTAGQWIEWNIDAPEDGLYEISLHVLQNFSKGIYVSRKISIDGEVPFAEFEDYGFIYKQSWRMETLAAKDGTPYKVYLTKGSHTLRMEAVLGSLSDVIGTVREAVYELNKIYRKVIRLTGVKPDKYRDYQIEYSLPELNGEMVAVRDKLQWAVDELTRAAGKRSDRERVLKTMITHLNELIKDGERFSKTVGTFRINVRACGTWLTQAVDQPLQLDTLTFHAPGEEIEVSGGSVFARIGYEISRLFYSFIIDYNQIGNVADKNESETVTLWIGSGRDQANVIKSLIDETFTRDSGINVNVMLVDMGTLLQATLAGQGPDVAIQIGPTAINGVVQSGNELPMNFGLRNAVADLTQFPDLEEVTKRFRESALTPFSYEGAIYALPETQTFPMMFYRKDILKEIGLALPTTWDEMKVAMAVLANNMMELGMQPSEQVYAMMLYQNGGEYYNEDATRSALDSEEGYQAFKKYTEFYTDYKLDKDTSVEERFRTGETPIIIQDYTFYNNLQVSAPDIKGLWGFAPVPATVREDGTTLDRSTGSAGTACVMMSASKVKNQAWEFMKWWTTADTQTLFGREMESLMGSAARVPTANIEAFDRLPWPIADYEALTTQYESVRGIPQVPGGYYSFRNITNAFYAVVTGRSVIGAQEDVFEFPREALTDKVILINDEINFKRKEFGMTLYEDREGG